MYRGLIFGSIAFAAVFAAERQLAAVAKDIDRYDRIRAMSGDSSLAMQGVGMLKDMIGSFGDARRGDTASAISSLQSDVLRYVRISNM